jgi:hypothetical protein
VAPLRRAGYAARSFSTRSLSDKACDESDEISPVVECFVIDRTAACRVGSSFDAKNRAPWFHF